MSGYIETYTGKKFFPLDPRVDDIVIDDIAHALSHQCRFSGHTARFYSVAEHCVRVSEYIEKRGYDRTAQMWGLMHDASEAYLVDLPSPLKALDGLGSAYRIAERNLMLVICERFGLPAVQPECVTEADLRLLATEARDLMPFVESTWAPQKLPRPLYGPILPWAASTAKAAFLSRFARLRGGA